ncbi:MAG: hypothetical protein HOO96_29025 [Polyangiaceae bacterium]|nr:hypothetical protein [Polyangiaceae bacterium]
MRLNEAVAEMVHEGNVFAELRDALHRRGLLVEGASAESVDVAKVGDLPGGLQAPPQTPATARVPFQAMIWLLTMPTP